jgi:hypothetical protein
MQVQLQQALVLLHSPGHQQPVDPVTDSLQEPTCTNVQGML